MEKLVGSLIGYCIIGGVERFALLVDTCLHRLDYVDRHGR